MEKKNMGRPQSFTPESLKEQAILYFAFCDDEENWFDKGIQGKVPKPKTLTGFCKWIGKYKDFFSEKCKDPNFSETTKRIRNQIENDIEEKILQGVYHGSSGIFNLKNNFGWVDKVETTSTDQTGEAMKEKLKGINTNAMTPEELQNKLNSLLQT